MQDQIFMATTILLGIVDAQGKRVFKKQLPNELAFIRKTLQPFQRELVDGLMEEGFKVHLANPSAIQQYGRLKYSDDKHDAFWWAEMLRLGIF